MDEDRMGLDLFRDVPAAYAVFQVIPNEGGSGAMDARYVYVNQLYCTIAGRAPRIFWDTGSLRCIPRGTLCGWTAATGR